MASGEVVGHLPPATCHLPPATWSSYMVWIKFIFFAAIVVIAAVKLAGIWRHHCRAVSKLGGLFVGTIFLAAATSLPELIAAMSSFRLGSRI
ncbi:MAG: hypothetical protein M5U34_26660 [Chloroflexi bacterium]|nr:hypothetical protein [Chloroflexota bacterium]